MLRGDVMSENNCTSVQQIVERLGQFSAWSDPYFEALTQIRRSCHNEALQLLIHSESLVPDDEYHFRADVAERIGFCYHQLKQHQKAEKYYEQALAFLSEEFDDKGRFKVRKNFGGINDEMHQSLQWEMDQNHILWLTTLNKQAGSRLNTLNRNYLWLLIEMGRTEDIAAVVTRVAALNAKFSVQLVDEELVEKAYSNLG